MPSLSQFCDLQWISAAPVATMQQAQLLMVAGFVMLGWVLARRQIKMRKKVNRDARAANRELKQIREHKEPSLPLSGAPPETQRWQVALFDLQRELKAELDTRIVVVQTLLRQVDQRIGRLEALQASGGVEPNHINSRGQVDTSGPGVTPIHGDQFRLVADLRRSGHSAQEIATETGLPLGDIELTISMLP